MDYQDIIRLVLNKDKAGLEALYTTYGQKFYSFAVSKWHLTEDDAWDVVYKTLETLVLKLPDYEFESKSHFDNFLFKVFVNNLRQHYRKHRHHQVEQLGTDQLFDETGTVELTSAELMEERAYKEDAAGEDESVSLDPSDFTMDHHALSEYYETDIVENPKLIALRKALEELDEVERDILLLRAQDYSYDEIAAMLKIENKQLKVRHHRIKSRLIIILNKNTLLNEQE